MLLDIPRSGSSPRRASRITAPFSPPSRINASVELLAQVGFFTPKVFRKLGLPRATRPSALSRQDGLKHARRPNASAFGFPHLLKLLWLKPPFARNLARGILQVDNEFVRGRIISERRTFQHRWGTLSRLKRKLSGVFLKVADPM